MGRKIRCTLLIANVRFVRVDMKYMVNKIVCDHRSILADTGSKFDRRGLPTLVVNAHIPSPDPRFEDVNQVGVISFSREIRQ